MATRLAGSMRVSDPVSKRRARQYWGKGLKHGTPRSTSVSSSGISLCRSSDGSYSVPLSRGTFDEKLRPCTRAATLSRKCAVSGKEIVPALFRGEEQLSELRRNSRDREHGIRLQVGIGAIMPTIEMSSCSHTDP